MREFDWRGRAGGSILIGGGLRRVTCPYCHSYDRERLLYVYLKARPELYRGARILHVAPDPNIESLIAPESVEHLTGDKLLDDYAMRLDICDLPFPDGSFDLILCNHVLEHVDDDGVAMRELLRVTRPGKTAILQVPWRREVETTIDKGILGSDEERLTIYGQEDHRRLYGQDYPRRLEEAGWSVEVVPSSAIVHASKHGRLGINSEEVVFVAKRPTEG